MGSLIAMVLSAPLLVQQYPPSGAELRSRLDRVVASTDSRWVLQPNTRPPAQPGFGYVFDWRNAAQGARLHILVRFYPDAAAAQDYVNELVTEGPTEPVHGIGDAARIGRDGEPVVHFSVDEIYVQLSISTSRDLATRLAVAIVEELRR